MQWLLGAIELIHLNAWKVVGLSGSVIFGLRFVLQWIASERAKKSIIPIGFWEVSLLGSLCALSYFIFYRRDSVGIIMTALPVPIYARNCFLKWREVISNRPDQAKSTAPVAVETADH